MLVPLIVSFWAMGFRCRWLQLVMDHWGSGSDGSGASTRPAVGSEGGGPRCSMCPQQNYVGPCHSRQPYAARS